MLKNSFIKKPRKNLINQKFGKWLVLKLGKRTNRGFKWVCICECGTKRQVLQHCLLAGESKSCGCYKYKIGEQNKRWKGYGDISGQWWIKLLDCSKSRNRKFNLTIKYIWDLFLKQNRKCALTRTKLIFGSIFKKIPTTASLDRIDSSRGYIKGNVQWVHKLVNKMKTDLNEKEFIYWCQQIAKYNKGENK